MGVLIFLLIVGIVWVATDLLFEEQPNRVEVGRVARERPFTSSYTDRHTESQRRKLAIAEQENRFHLAQGEVGGKRFRLFLVDHPFDAFELRIPLGEAAERFGNDPQGTQRPTTFHDAVRADILGCL